MANIRDRFQRLINPPEDEYEDYYEDEQEDSGYASFAPTHDRDNKVVNFNQKSQMQLVVYKPTSFGEEVRTIADELLQRHTVVLNLERTDKEAARRIVDFLSGVAYANNGKLKPISSNIVIVTPFNVDLTGDDVMDELESSGIYF